ncbi:MAG: ImuA family protein [Cohaesibacteraceae bacterium]
MQQQTLAQKPTLEALKRVCAQDQPAPHGHISLGTEELDEAVGGGLARGALHDLYAPHTTSLAAMAGFACGILQRSGKLDPKPSLWVRQHVASFEVGRLHAPGFTQLGPVLDTLVLVNTRTVADLLAAGLEAARCTALGTVVLELWNRAGELDLTITRRLALAAEQSGVTVLMLQVAAQPLPSAAITRWQVTPAPSRPMAANAPGHPSFDLTLLRNRAGKTGQRWRVEWQHETGQFQSVPSSSRTALSRRLVSLSGSRPVGPPDGKAGSYQQADYAQALARTG